jgi:topoisomerase-4 subunit A
MHYYAAPADQALLLASSNGFGFIAKVGDMVSRVKAGKSFMTIDEGATPLVPMPMQALAIGKAGVVLLGTGRGGKAYEETLSGAALTPHIGKRARKGRAPDSKLKLLGMRPALRA